MLTMMQIGTSTPRCFEGTFPIDTTATGESDYVMINPDAAKVSVQLKVLSTAKATIQATVSTIAEVIAGTADWVTWQTGEVTGGAVEQDSLDGPATALRVNVTTAKAGTQAYMSVRTQGSKV